jgi:hypothetical protein
MTFNSATLAIYTLALEDLKRLHGATLNPLAHRMIETDDSYAFPGTEREQKNYHRLGRSIAG